VAATDTRMKRASAFLFLLAGCNPAVVTESTTTAIGPEGGVAISVDGRLQVTVPPGALAAETEITIATDRGLTGGRQIGLGYRLGPTNLAFDAPVEVSLQAPASWVGELLFGSTRSNDTNLKRGFFDTTRRTLSVRIQRMTCGGEACATAFDCGEGLFCGDGVCQSECSDDIDCAAPIDCDTPEQSCAPRGLRCDATGRCVAPGETTPLEPATPPSYATASPMTCLGDSIALHTLERADTCGGRVCGEGCEACDPSSPTCQNVEDGVCDVGGACVTSAAQCPVAPRTPEGWDDAPNTGRMFIVSALAIATPGGSFGDVLAPLGPVSNDQIRQGLLGGETLLLVEISGIDTPYNGSDSSVTVKVYAARDFDDPFFPANNFSVPVGEVLCCQFLIDRASLAGNQARVRVPGRITRGQLTTLAEFPIQLPLISTGPQPRPELRLGRARLTAHLPANLQALENARIGGVLASDMLATIESPFCATLDPLCPAAGTTLLDLVETFATPDVDLDVPANGVDDGYSITFDAQAVAASVMGVAQ